GRVYEHVLRAVGGGDEAKPLCTVEEFDRAVNSHARSFPLRLEKPVNRELTQALATQVSVKGTRPVRPKGSDQTTKRGPTPWMVPSTRIWAAHTMLASCRHNDRPWPFHAAMGELS